MEFCKSFLIFYFRTTLLCEIITMIWTAASDQIACNSDPLYSLYTVCSFHLSGAACIPAVSVLSTILVILLVLVLVLTVTVLLLCCKPRTLNTGNVQTCACALCNMLWYVQYYTCIISDITVTSYTARTSSPETDTVKKAGVTSPSQHTDVVMTHNPAYGPIATLKGEAQYEEVAS